MLKCSQGRAIWGSVLCERALTCRACRRASGSSLPVNLTSERRASTILVRPVSGWAAPRPCTPPSRAASSWSRPPCPFSSYSVFAASGATCHHALTKLLVLVTDPAFILHIQQVDCACGWQQSQTQLTEQATRHVNACSIRTRYSAQENSLICREKVDGSQCRVKVSAG